MQKGDAFTRARDERKQLDFTSGSSGTTQAFSEIINLKDSISCRALHLHNLVAYFHADPPSLPQPSLPENKWIILT